MTCENDVVNFCFQLQNSLIFLNFWMQQVSLLILSHGCSMIQIQRTPMIPDFDLWRQVSPLLHPSIRQGKHLSASLENSTLHRVLNFFSSCLPVSPQLRFSPDLTVESYFFVDEELAGTGEDKFIAVGLDFATIFSSSFCSCTHFAIFLVQLGKLEFLVKQVELFWLMLNK